MTQYDNTNSGALFKNYRKDSDRHPDYKGTINVDGKDYDIAAWLRESKKGDKFMSLKVSEPYQKPTQSGGANTGYSGLDDEVPFSPEWR